MEKNTKKYQINNKYESARYNETVLPPLSMTNINTSKLAAIKQSEI